MGLAYKASRGAPSFADGAVTSGKLAGAIPDGKLSTITTVGKVSDDAISSGTISGTAGLNSYRQGSVVTDEMLFTPQTLWYYNNSTSVDNYIDFRGYTIE